SGGGGDSEKDAVHWVPFCVGCCVLVGIATARPAENAARLGNSRATRGNPPLGSRWSEEKCPVLACTHADGDPAHTAGRRPARSHSDGRCERRIPHSLSRGQGARALEDRAGPA